MDILEKISGEDAESLTDIDIGKTVGQYQKVDEVHLEIGRWSQYRRVVFEYDGTLYAFDYALGLTEMQENDYPWFDWGGRDYNDVEVFRVSIYAKTVFEYPKLK